MATRHCRRRAIYRLPRSPSQTCHAKPKTQINRRRTLPASFPVGGMPTASSVGLKDFSPKVRTLWHCSRLRSVALYLWLIVVISAWVIDRCSNILPPLPVGIARFTRLTAWLQNSKKRRNGWEIDASRVSRDDLRLAICIIVCLPGLHYYRDNAITYKAQRDKNARELKLANAAITDMQTRQRDVAALDAKIHEGVSWC